MKKDNDTQQIRIIEDEYFIQFLKEEIYSLKIQRWERKPPPAGMTYKNDWLDRMEREDTFNATYFINNIEAIWNKQSNLPSLIRNVIQSICYKAVQKMDAKYNEE